MYIHKMTDDQLAAHIRRSQRCLKNADRMKLVPKEIKALQSLIKHCKAEQEKRGE